MEKSDPCEEPLNQKADSRPAIRECREQSLQAKSCRGLMFADAKVSIDAFVQWARLIFCEQIKNILFPERARGL